MFFHGDDATLACSVRVCVTKAIKDLSAEVSPEGPGALPETDGREF